MQKTRTFFLLAALFAGSVLAAQVDIDEDYMRSVEDTQKSLVDNLAGKNAKASTADATELAGMFAQVEAFYVAKGDAVEALKLSTKSKELSSEIVKLVGAKDFASASGKVEEIQRACKSCHNFYKKS
jgi:hypothetical protein